MKSHTRCLGKPGNPYLCTQMTHRKSFPAPEARRIAKKLEIHYTPKHGDWLDIAEIELNVMTRQCLSWRIADIVLLRQELAVWESDRNEHTVCVHWQFTTDRAKTKLLSLYPKFDVISVNIPVRRSHLSDVH